MVLFSPESDAVAHGGGMGKRIFMEKNDFQVSINAMASAYLSLPLIV